MGGRTHGRILSLLSPLQMYRLNQQSLIDAELAAYDTAFSVVENALDALCKGAFLQTAEGNLLKQYESMVGLPERHDIDDARRREMVVYRLSVAPFDFTAKKMLESGRAAGIEALIIENNPEESLVIRTRELIDPTLNMDVARLRLETLLPAHLDWELDFGELTWDMLETTEPDWDDWDNEDFNWDVFDTGGHHIFPGEI